MKKTVQCVSDYKFPSPGRVTLFSGALVPCLLFRRPCAYYVLALPFSLLSQSSMFLRSFRFSLFFLCLPLPQTTSFTARGRGRGSRGQPAMGTCGCHGPHGRGRGGEGGNRWFQSRQKRDGLSEVGREEGGREGRKEGRKEGRSEAGAGEEREGSKSQLFFPCSSSLSLMALLNFTPRNEQSFLTLGGATAQKMEPRSDSNLSDNDTTGFVS